MKYLTLMLLLTQEAYSNKVPLERKRARPSHSLMKRENINQRLTDFVNDNKHLNAHAKSFESLATKKRDGILKENKF
jgi:hypothetical protein